MASGGMPRVLAEVVGILTCTTIPLKLLILHFSHSYRYIYIYSIYKLYYIYIFMYYIYIIYIYVFKVAAQKTPQQKPSKWSKICVVSVAFWAGKSLHFETHEITIFHQICWHPEIQGALNDHHHSVLHAPWSQHHQIGGSAVGSYCKFWTDSKMWCVFFWLIFLELAKEKGRGFVTIFGKHHQTINNIAY